MNFFRKNTCLFWIPVTLAAGGLSGWLSREGIRIFSQYTVQPPLTPPAWVFPVVWSLLYVLMGVSAARICEASPGPKTGSIKGLYLLQLIVNFFWSPIFFLFQAYGFAFLWLILLWLLVFAMIRRMYRTDPLAGKLQLPYLLWLTFAAFLNFGVWYLNN